MGSGAPLDSVGAGDGRTPRYKRAAPVVLYREWAGISLNIPCVLLEGASGAVKAIGERASLRRAGTAQPGKGKIQGDLGASSSGQRGCQGWEGLGARTRSGRKSGNGFKLGKGRSRWDIGKKFLQRNVGASQHIPNQPPHWEHPKMLQNMEYP